MRMRFSIFRTALYASCMVVAPLAVAARTIGHPGLLNDTVKQAEEMVNVTLQPGDAAPDFATTDEKGNMVSLKDFRGKKLLLYFYPKDNTPGCTAEACSLRDGFAELKANGVEVLGVSPQSERSHIGFIAKHNLPFRLLADTTHAVAEAYGVWQKKKMAGREYMGMARVSFLIGEDGRILQIFSKVTTDDHAGQVLDWLKGKKQ